MVTFFELGAHALANSLLNAPNQAERTYPLELSFCRNCGLVQLNHTLAPEALFSHYVWVTGTSSMARNQSGRFCEEALARLPGQGNAGFVVEIASNDGTFLRPFMERGLRVLGVEPAGNIVEQARAAGISTRHAFFGEAEARAIVAESGPPVLVIARNVLAHVANLHDFVRGLVLLAGDDGLVVIEVHYGAKILADLQYDSIYHEHLCYFTAQSLAALLRRFGLTIVDVGESPISGGALVVYARRAGHPVSEAVARMLEAEQRGGVNELKNWECFAARAREHALRLHALLDEERVASHIVVGYGASARSSTLLSFSDIGTEQLAMIADQNPMKRGLFTAGSHIPIDLPEAVMQLNPQTVVVLAWNFLDEIREVLRERFAFKGRLLVPLPNAPVVEQV
jgi:hypothetical protein